MEYAYIFIIHLFAQKSIEEYGYNLSRKQADFVRFTQTDTKRRGEPLPILFLLSHGIHKPHERLLTLRSALVNACVLEHLQEHLTDLLLENSTGCAPAELRVS